MFKRVSLKKLIEIEVGPVLAAKGFEYNPEVSRPSEATFSYTKGDPRPIPRTWKPGDDIPRRHEIVIYRNRFAPEISAQVVDLVGRRADNLGGLFAAQEIWWRADTPEQTRESLKEIAKLIDEYAWTWFESQESVTS